MRVFAPQGENALGAEGHVRNEAAHHGDPFLFCSVTHSLFPSLLNTGDIFSKLAALVQSSVSGSEEVVVEIVESSSKTSRKGEVDYFTGNVWVDEIVVGKEPSRVRLFRVTL